VLDARVNDIEIAGDRWIAATSNGLYFSKDQGKVWMGGPVQGEKDFLSVRSKGNTVVAAAPINVFVSTDGGTTFTQHSLKQYVTNIRGVTVTPDAHIFVASREGAFESPDDGATWTHVLTGLPDKDITSIVYDANGKPSWLVATCTMSGSSCSGTLYRTTGPAFNAPWDPSRVTTTPVGTASLSFSDGNSGTFSYTVDGVSGSKPITRQVFANPKTTCN